MITDEKTTMCNHRLELHGMSEDGKSKWYVIWSDVKIPAGNELDDYIKERTEIDGDYEVSYTGTINRT